MIETTLMKAGDGMSDEMVNYQVRTKWVLA
jgi:hypothetical protein